MSHTLPWPSIALKIKPNSSSCYLSLTSSEAGFWVQPHFLSFSIRSNPCLLSYGSLTHRNFAVYPLCWMLSSLSTIWLTPSYYWDLGLNISSLGKQSLGIQSKITPPSLSSLSDSICSYSPWVVCQIAKAASTKYHRPNSLNNKLSPHSFAGQKLEVKVWVGLVSSEASLRGLHMATFSHVFLSVFTCVPRFPSCKDISQIGLGPNLVTSL